MVFCKKCGKELRDGAKYCNRCGAEAPVKKETESIKEIKTTTEREKVYEGRIHKCPSCGETLTSFTGVCPLCGVELRGADSSAIIREFSDKFERASSVENKMALVRSFPVPNTKEDIIEFMILACSNFDAEYYIAHLGVEDISDAWLSKIEMCFNKASMVFPDAPEYNKMIDMYNGVHAKIEKHKSLPKDETAVAKEPSSTIASASAATAEKSTYSAGMLLVVCLFLGCFGAHKFLEGKTGAGILYLLTGGVFGIGWFVDIVMYLAKALGLN